VRRHGAEYRCVKKGSCVGMSDAVEVVRSEVSSGVIKCFYTKCGGSVLFF
jgi:hypothetical protein